MKSVLLLLSCLMLFISGCTNIGLPATEISECDAVRIARQQVPPRIAEVSPAAGFRHELGPHGTWFITFPNVNTTLEELGWIENKNTHFITSDNAPWEKDIPEGQYRNVTIYVDADTGIVSGQEANNGLLLGGPSSFPDCD